MNSPFVPPAPIGVIVDPVATGERLYFRSDDSGDTNLLTITGSIGVTIQSETIALTGQEEQDTGNTYDNIVGLSISSPAAGTITIYGQGEPGQGTLIFESVPPTGEELEIGLLGSTVETFTFVPPPVDSVTITSISASDYIRFDYSDPSTVLDPFVVYFTVDGGGSSPSLGGTEIVCAVLSGDTNAQMATKLAAAINGAGSPFSNYVAASVDGAITNKVYWVSKALGLGALSGFGLGLSFAEVETGVATASNQLRTGWSFDGEISTVADMGQSFDGLSSALVTAEYSGSTVTLTDKIACNRQLPWNINQPSGTSISIVQPVGGVDGPQLAALGPGTLSIYDGVPLDQYQNPGGTLPGLLTFTSEWIVVSGAAADLWISCNNVVTPITARYETTIDPALSSGSERVGESSISNIDNNIQRISIPEKCEAIRLVILTNSNVATSLLDARLLFGS